MRTTFISIIASALLAAAACGGNNGDGPNNGDTNNGDANNGGTNNGGTNNGGTNNGGTNNGGTNNAGTNNGDNDSISQLVTAADGGTLNLPGVTLTIPAGALAEDTEISIARQDGSQYTAPSGGLHSDVFDTGPDGLQFLQPVTIEIDFTGTPGDEEQAAVAWYDSSTWQVLADSSTSGSAVIATTTHFTPFAVIFFENAATAECPLDTFTECGGDVAGVWAIQNACGDLGDPFNGECPEAIIETVLQVSGTVEFVADNTYLDRIESDITVNMEFPPTCLPAGSACEDIGATSSGDSCLLNQAIDDTPELETGTWELVNGQMCLTKDDGGDADCFDYCVMGDTLSMRKYDPMSGEGFMYDLQRQ